MNIEDFYEQCAIAAMQGIQESGTKAAVSIGMAHPETIAAMAFDLADAMIEEYIKRKYSSTLKKQENGSYSY